MTILLIGGTGTLGRRTLTRLVAAGHEVVAVTGRPGSHDALAAAGATPVRADVFDRRDVDRVVADVRPDAVVNLATRIPPAARALRPRAWAANDRLRRDASRVLARAAADHGARYVQESFAPTYPDRGPTWITEEVPLAPVDQTRTVVDAEEHATEVTAGGGVGVVLRFGLFHDPEGAQTQQLLDGARRGRFALPGRADAHVSMILVDDAAAAVVASLEVPAGAYNVVDDAPATRQEHVDVLAELLGRDVRLLPGVIGHLPRLRVVARSHRISNAKLEQASGWRPQASGPRALWTLALAAGPRPAEAVGRR